MALEICWGRRVRGNKRLECGEPVNDPRIIEETMKLINEFLNRVGKHRSVLLSDITTPFDYAINALSNWLQEIKAKVEESNDESIANLRRAMHKIAKRMLRLLKRARERWLSTYKPELEELINELGSGGARVIISGDPFDSNKPFVVHLYAEKLAVAISRVRNSVMVNITLAGLEGVHVITLKLINDEVLRASQCGLMLTDGSIDKDGYPIMNTNRLWQAVIFPLTFPGKVHVYINGLSVNDGGVSVVWQLRAVDYRGVFKSKTEVAEDVVKLSDENFLAFLLFAILGDGSIDIKKKRIELIMDKSKHGLWSDIIEKIKSLGFRERDGEYKMEYAVNYSKAVELARKIVSDQVSKALIEDLSRLLDAEKLKRLLVLASMRIKPLGRSMIEVVEGIRMNVCAHNYSVELRVHRMDYGEAVRILELLRNTGYRDAKLSKRSGRYVVYLNIDAIKKHPELVAKVCEVLRRMLEEVISEGKERRARSIARAMARLSCQ